MTGEPNGARGGTRQKKVGTHDFFSNLFVLSPDGYGKRDGVWAETPMPTDS